MTKALRLVGGVVATLSALGVMFSFLLAMWLLTVWLIVWTAQKAGWL